MSPNQLELELDQAAAGLTLETCRHPTDARDYFAPRQFICRGCGAGLIEPPPATGAQAR